MQIKALTLELAVVAGAALAVLGLFRVRWAIVLWHRLRLMAFLYVGGVIVLALLQFFFHIRL